MISKLSGKRELPLTSLPLLVRFRDLNDPTTAEKVDPLNIGEQFGAGARLTGATLEIVPVGIWPLNLIGLTGVPVTTGIEKILTWIPRYYDVQLDGDRGESISARLRLANSLSSGAFKVPR